MDNLSLDRRLIYLFFLDAGVLLDSLSRDGRGRFRRVVLLNASCGSGDGSPSLATTDTDGDGAKRDYSEEEFPRAK